MRSSHSRSICLAILNYNGRRHLEHLLPTAITEAARFGRQCSVTVIDNRSTNDDVEWIRTEFPSVSIWLAPRNEYLFSYNTFAEESPADILVFLNNDLKLLEGFVSPLVCHFDTPDIFAVSATSRDWENTEFTFGPVRLGCHHGMYYWLPDCGNQNAGSTLFASGGFMAVDRKKFIELGGFSRLFFPAYGEDLDLCVRGWRRGWRCLFEPRSVVLHRESASWGIGVGSRADRLRTRAALLFQWSCLPLSGSLTIRAAHWMLWSLRKLAQGQAWWILTAIKTRIEWTSLRAGMSLPPLTADDLARITRQLQD